MSSDGPSDRHDGHGSIGRIMNGFNDNVLSVALMKMAHVVESHVAWIVMAQVVESQVALMKMARVIESYFAWIVMAQVVQSQVALMKMAHVSES